MRNRKSFFTILLEVSATNSEIMSVFAKRSFSMDLQQLTGVSTIAGRVVKNGYVVSILRVLMKRGGANETTGGVSAVIR